MAAAFVFASPASTYAVPANPFAFVFQQEDDSEIVLNFRGDEFFAWWEDESGNIVAFDEASGNWRYAYVVDGIIAPVGQPVGRFDGEAAQFARIERGAIMPLISNGWRFDPGDPMVEFLNGQVLIDHRPVAAVQPVVPTETQNPIIDITPIQGQAITPPTIPNIPNVVGPHTVTGTPGPVPPPTTPPPPVQGDDDHYLVPTARNILGDGFAANISVPISAPMASTAAGDTAPHIQTNQRLLVLLVEFEDMPLINDSAFYHNKYFNTTPGAVSVANYFRDMSGGHDVFIPAGNVVDGGTFRVALPDADMPWAQAGVDVTIMPSVHNGIVRVKLHMSHPVAAWATPTGHQSVRDTISLALAAISENTNFNFEGVHVGSVFAGGEASDNYNPGGQIWGHAWQFRGATVGQQGWPRYMAYGERQRNGHIMGIGIAVHELGHVLGLPDLYDLSGQSEGVGPYSIMAFGSWGRGPNDAAAGHRPTAFDPWSLIQLGYARPTIISSGTWRGYVNSLNTYNYNILMITSPAGISQYFLVENRQMDSMWDAGLNQWITTEDSRGGIMIFHVDDAMRSTNPTDMMRNNNNRHHMMVDVREADGSGLLNASVVNWGAKQDHFFSADNFYRFNADTNPASHFFTGSGAPGSRTVPTGVEIIIHSQRGDVMEIEINLEQSGGAASPVIGPPQDSPPAPLSSASSPQGAALAAQEATAAQNHTRIRNQVLLNAETPTLILPENTREIQLSAQTLNLLVDSGSVLAINSDTHSIIFPTALLAEMAAAGDYISISVRGAEVSILSNGQILAGLQNIYQVSEK
jgi:M6 family metalloprotease-like protein